MTVRVTFATASTSVVLRQSPIIVRLAHRGVNLSLRDRSQISRERCPKNTLSASYPNVKGRDLVWHQPVNRTAILRVFLTNGPDCEKCWWTVLGHGTSGIVIALGPHKLACCSGLMRDGVAKPSQRMDRGVNEPLHGTTKTLVGRSACTFGDMVYRSG
jgi:hypothetical protein